MLIVYRYSDAGHIPSDSGWDITKADCFHSFYKRFKDHNLVFICDNCSDETIDSFIKLNNGDVYATRDGAHYGLLNSLQRILDTYPNEDSYYFAEDDYLYSADDPYKLLTEGLEKADYCTLYDHGDKYPSYHYAPNPLLTEDGERTLLYRTDSIHWKITNSLTYTFAVKRATLLNDISVFNHHIYDFATFTALKEQGRIIPSSLPGKSTHIASGPGITSMKIGKQYESPFFEYELSD